MGKERLTPGEKYIRATMRQGDSNPEDKEASARLLVEIAKSGDERIARALCGLIAKQLAVADGGGDVTVDLPVLRWLIDSLTQIHEGIDPGIALGIKNPKGGRKRNSGREVMITAKVLATARSIGSVNRAVAAAAEEYELEERRVWSIYAKWKDLVSLPGDLE